MQRGNSTASRDIANHLHPYTNLKKHESEGPLVITEGKGIHVYDENGKEYIEGLAGLWCAGLGLSELTDAVTVVVSEETGNISGIEEGKDSVMKRKATPAVAPVRERRADRGLGICRGC